MRSDASMIAHAVEPGRERNGSDNADESSGEGVEPQNDVHLGTACDERGPRKQPISAGPSRRRAGRCERAKSGPPSRSAANVKSNGVIDRALLFEPWLVRARPTSRE